MSQPPGDGPSDSTSRSSSGSPSRSWSLIKSGYHAFAGLIWVAPRTPSLKLGIAASAAVVVLGVVLRFTPVEIAVLILTGTLVLAVETLNTAIEMLCDRVQPEHDPQIGKIKDVAAGATAFTEIGGAAVVVVIIGSHVLAWIGH